MAIVVVLLWSNHGNGLQQPPPLTGVTEKNHGD